MLIQRIKHLVLTLMIALSGTLVLAPAVASADFKSDACAGVTALDSTASCTGSSSKGIDNIIRWVVNILSVIVGFVAVIMIIIGGLKYITSAGDSNAAASARNTILYAIIGLVIVALAQVIVHFVLKKVATVH